MDIGKNKDYVYLSFLHIYFPNILQQAYITLQSGRNV